MSKYSLISRYQKRSEMFVERILSLLMQMKLNDNFSKEVDNFHEEMVHAGVPGEDAYDCLVDFESSLADEYLLLSDGIYSAVLTAFYHLWERDVKDLCKRMLRYYPVEDQRNRIITEDIVQKYQYYDLKGLLEFWGAEELIFAEINLLRLMVNTIKHGLGPSADELSKNNCSYHRKLALLCDLELADVTNSDDAMVLDIDDIKYFGAVLSSFWMELGKKISI